MRLKQLGEGCLEVPARLAALEVTGVACDSREVKPGHAFVALPGERTDGHLFACQAVQAGAVLVVGEQGRLLYRRPGESHRRAISVPFIKVADSRQALGRLAANFHSRPDRQLTITGVTGTKGKTTTTWILDAIHRRAGKETALFGTVHNRVGGDVYPSGNTTPPALYLQGKLRELVNRGGSHAAIEVSSHGILQGRVAGIDFRCGILTNVAPEHLDYHKSIEAYVAAKVRFFTALSSAAFAVLPRAREDVTPLATSAIVRRSRAEVVWYGTESQDGIDDVRLGPEGMQFRWKGLVVRAGFWGYHNLLNIVAAMTAAECIGIAREDIVSGVEGAVAPPGRMEEVRHQRPFRVFVDYAHTDGSLDAVLRSLRAMTRARVITVFGCGGDRDSTKRPRMGKVAEKWSNNIVVTSDNPRTEDPTRILEDIKAGLQRPDEAVFEIDRREAIALGIRMARAGDIVLIAGKGHETYQEIQGRKLHFDDREVAGEFLVEEDSI